MDCRLSPIASDNHCVDHTNALSVGEAFILNVGKLKIVCFGDIVGASAGWICEKLSDEPKIAVDLEVPVDHIEERSGARDGRRTRQRLHSVAWRLSCDCRIEE